MQNTNTLPENRTTQPIDVKVRIHSIKPEGSMRAQCSLELGGCFAVRGVRLMDGANGHFLSMPSYKSGDGYKDLCFPVTKEFREKLLDTVVQEYEQALEQTRLSGHNREPRAGLDVEMEDEPEQGGAEDPVQTALPSGVPPSYYAEQAPEGGQQFGAM